MAITSTKIIWICGYPAHYTRVFHCKLEKMYPKMIMFAYSDLQDNQRSYEKGELPKNVKTLDEHGSFFEVGRILASVAPQAILVCGHYPRTQLYAALWGFIRNIPVLYFCDTNLHDVLEKGDWQRFWRKHFFSWYFGRMSALLHPGIRTLDYYIWAAGKKAVSKSIKLPFPALIHPSCVCRNYPSSDFNILYLGRLSPEKAVDQLIKAFALLKPDCRSKTRLVIAGDGPERNNLQHLAADLHIASQVEFLGAVDSDQVRQLYNDASIFVLPSYTDAWGLVIVEALAAGLPVIAPCWVGAVADLVVDGVTGMVLRDNSPNEIANAISYVLSNPETMEIMQTNSRKIIVEGNWGIKGALDGFANVLIHLGLTK